jgi:hypothetical protein
MKPMASGLGSLFGSGGGADDADDDPLVYKKPRDPLSAAPASAPAPAKVRAGTGRTRAVPVMRARKGAPERDALTRAHPQSSPLPFLPHHVQKPSAAATASAPAPAPAPAPAAAASSAPAYIFASSVPALYKYTPETKKYESRSTGPVGCAIVGSGASYSFLFYDQNKQTICVAPVTPSVRAPGLG